MHFFFRADICKYSTDTTAASIKLLYHTDHQSDVKKPRILYSLHALEILLKLNYADPEKLIKVTVSFLRRCSHHFAPSKLPHQNCLALKGFTFIHFGEADFQDNGQIIYKINDLLSEPGYSEYSRSNDSTFPA